ncbi:hypothetical protein ACFPRA_17785 [Sporosarcina soli]|uniref:Phage holin family protein n=1 Tax=Sporosarcina soli TaxID=334736 RepID=A0ABW0TPE3_9BACL
MMKLFKWIPGLLVIIGGIITILTMTTEIREFNESLEDAKRYPIYRDILKFLSPIVLIYDAARIVGVVITLLGILLLWRPSFLNFFIIILLSGLLFNWPGFLFAFIGGVVGVIVAQRTVAGEIGETEKIQE